MVTEQSKFAFKFFKLWESRFLYTKGPSLRSIGASINIHLTKNLPSLSANACETKIIPTTHPTSKRFSQKNADFTAMSKIDLGKKYKVSTDAAQIVRLTITCVG